MKDKVLVLLSTYNGEKYIETQLNSILRQENVEVTLLIRDDKSKDGTLGILESYAAKYPGKVNVVSGENLGCTGSFISLMKMAAKAYPNFKYYAFADQDDVWMPEKLYAGVSALDRITNPIRLYYCHPKLVDDNLCPLPQHPINALNTLEEAFILQPCIGCSMIFSPSVLQQAAQVDYKKIVIHDAWTYKVALVLGGTIIQDKTPHILYRQHSSNTIGGSQSIKNKLHRRINKFIGSRRIKSEQARLLRETYADIIPEHNLNILHILSTYRNDIGKKIKLLFSNRFKSCKPGHNLMFKFAILFNKI